MKNSGAPEIAFIVIGVVFMAIGSSGQKAFIGVGAAFIVVGVVAWIRRRRAAGLK